MRRGARPDWASSPAAGVLPSALSFDFAGAGVLDVGVVSDMMMVTMLAC